MPVLLQSAFWLFSLSTYAAPGVAEACLVLQDEAGADVNMVLFALWAASLGQRLREEDIAAIEGTVEPWRSGVVRPLRAARRGLKRIQAGGDAARLRTAVQQSELEAERLQQALMEPLMPAREPICDETLAQDNLTAYAVATGLSLPGPAIDALLAAIRTAPASPGSPSCRPGRPG